MAKFLVVCSILVFLASCGDDGFTFEEQLALDIAAIDRYLETNGVDAEIHESGIRFVATYQGDGVAPDLGGYVVMHTDFAVLGATDSLSTSEYGASFIIDNADYLLALSLMLPEMNEGGEMTIYAPSGYCFGESSSSSIPANSNIVFDLKLEKVVADQFSADTVIINNYLEINEIEAIEHSSGIKYVVQTEGTGDSPELGDEVQVTYEGRFLTDEVFDQTTTTDGINFELSGLIEAWQIMIPEMQVGGEITIYVPSTYGYGTTGNGSIGPNTVLVFDIGLLAIN